MARTVSNPAFVPNMNRKILLALDVRTQAMTREAQAEAQPKSRRWAAGIVATKARMTGIQSFRSEIGTTPDAFPGFLKERGTGPRTQRSTGRFTGRMPADPVFVPLAARWARVPFKFTL